ncbi:hypothetical protein [Acinetobacter cumulans]|uniref:hypothetical protein n=1 Tax=Acinetobacter cumulans TaxID=2136182 RepID=UPI00148E733F|nr:hypothetical protein [Acinetobacter cumulans]
MYREPALVRIEILISQITSEYEKGIAIGFIGACFTFNLISLGEYRDFCDSCDRVLAE